MSIAHAKRFIHRVLAEADLVDRINDAPDEPTVRDILAHEGFEFNANDFDEAFHNLLTQCQWEDQADCLQGVRMWWEFLGASFQRTNPNLIQ